MKSICVAECESTGCEAENKVSFYSLYIFRFYIFCLQSLMTKINMLLIDKNNMLYFFF